MKKLLLYLIYTFLIFQFSESYSGYEEIHCKHFLYGYPLGSPKTNDLIIRDIYALSNNDHTKFADWVAYRLDSATITGPSRKDRRWAADPWLDQTETLEPNDYRNAPKELAIDRGHQAPLANFKGCPEIDEANYLSNITPQKSFLNQGPWKNLEDKERQLTYEWGLVYVLTGPLYEKIMPELPSADEIHRLPSGYWKIIAIPYQKDIYQPHKIQIFGFIFEQDTQKKSELSNHLVSIDEIELRSGLDFFNELDDALENILEAKPNANFSNYFK